METQASKASTHWLDRPSSIPKLWVGFVVVLSITVVAEFFVSLHPHFDVENFPAFNALYGFLTCILMIIVAKGLAIFLKRPDTYYREQSVRGKSNV